MGTTKGHGKYIETPEKLWELFLQYVAKEKSNPWTKVEYVGRDGRREDTPLMVPITFEGFECWLQDEGLVSDLSSYERNKDNSYADYVPILTRIKQNCFVQNFKGAAVGAFNPALIAKKLGLIEKQEVTQKQEQPIFGDGE